MCPQNFQRRGEVANSCHPATSGTQNSGEPSAHEGGKTWGVQGGEAPLAGGFGGVPHKTLKGASCPPKQTRPEWDPKRRQTLSQRGWGK